MPKLTIFDSKGVELAYCPEHPRAHRGYVRKHILFAEYILGKPLPENAVVHHYTPEQIVICQNDTYHKLLHQRQRAYEASGHANWRKCSICKKYDSPENLFLNSKHRHSYHRSCINTYNVMRLINIQNLAEQLLAD